MINREATENINVDNNVEVTKSSNVLKPVIKNNQNKKPIKPIAPMKVGRK